MTNFVYVTAAKWIKKITFGIHKKIFFICAVSCILLSVAISTIIINISGSYMREQIYTNMGNYTQQLSNVIDNHFWIYSGVILP